MKKLYSFLITIFSISCGTHVNYLGTSYQPTTTIDVFVDKSSIKKDYEIMGKGFDERALGYPNPETVQKKAVKLARNKGADAVLFEEYFLVNNNAEIQTFSKTDSVARHVSAYSNLSFSPALSSGYKIYFLKYKQEQNY